MRAKRGKCTLEKNEKNKVRVNEELKWNRKKEKTQKNKMKRKLYVEKKSWVDKGKEIE